ncbi:MAG: SIMPL domain-containing protein [Cyclobacteriaceae bacterium]
MKYLFIVAIIFSNLLVQAQNSNPMENVIEVISSIKIKKSVSRYRTRITLSLDQLYYTDSDCKTIEELTEKYFDKLKSNGIDPRKLVESKIDFLSSGYQKDGTIFDFETSSEEEIMNVLKARVPGVLPSYIEYQLTFDDSTYDEIVSQSLEAAKLKASRIAKANDQGLGRIISISDNTPTPTVWSSTHDHRYDEYFQLKVVFEML